MKKGFWNRDWNKYIGYILFVATLITWAYNAGKTTGRLTRIEETHVEISQKLEKIQDALIEQNELNGRIIQYIEIELSNNE